MTSSTLFVNLDSAFSTSVNQFSVAAPQQYQYSVAAPQFQYQQTYNQFSHHGLLGPAPAPRQVQYPQQAHFMHGQFQQPSSSMTPTELGQAFSSLNMQQPDNNWYMDSGVTSHLTRSAGSGTQFGDMQV